MPAWRPAGAFLAGAMMAVAVSRPAAAPASPPTARVSVQGGTTPTLTLLYQNFPNPFPAPGTPFTCIWFDLHRASQVRLTIHDVRGTLLRTIVPSPFFSPAFPAGRFGRGDPDTNVGCDPRFSWDGNDTNGRTVPPGIYLARLRTERFEGVKKIVFRGR